MTSYSTTLQSNSATHFMGQYIAGTKTLTITFYWPDQIQEQYDHLVLYLEKLAKANPFINDETKKIVRDYDILDVLENGFDGYHPANGSTMEAWTEAMTEYLGTLPDQYEYFTEMLAWNLLIDDGSETYSSVLRIGGTLTSSDKSWSLYFTTTKSDEVIGQDDLDAVTMHVEVT